MELDGNERGGLTIASRTLLAPIAWGTTYVTITEMLPDGRPLLVALVRVTPAAVALLAVSWARHRWVPIGREWWHLALLSTFNFALFFPLLIVAVYRLPGGVAAAVGGTQPLLVGAITWAITGRRLSRFDAFIGLAAVTGVALIVIRRGAGIEPVGILAAIGANLSFSCGVVATKRLPPPRDQLGATGCQLALAATVIAPLTLLIEGPPPIPTTTNLVGFGYLSLIATGGAFVIWFSGIRRLPTQAPPLLGLASPLTGAIVGWALLDERLSAVQLLGFTITFAAIGYAATRGSRHDAAPPIAGEPSRREQRIPDPTTGSDAISA